MPQKGDLSLLADAITDLSNLPGTETHISAPGSSLYVAVEHQHLHVIAFLLSRSAKIGEGHMKAAIWTHNTKIIQILLDHGWDINAPLSPSQPPPMS